MRRGFLRAFFLTGSSMLLICVAARSSRATTAIMLSDREMVINSRVILTGTVGSVTSAWDQDHQMIWSYAEIRRDRLLNGKLDQASIVLKQLGGTAGDTSVRVFGEPEFTPGQRVLVYLDTAPDGSLRVAQAFMGMFVITKALDTGRETVSRLLDGAEVMVLPRADQEPVTNVDGLNNYIRRIKSTLKNDAELIAESDAARSSEPMVAVPPEYERVKRQSRGFSPQYV